jgi:hypothetical protein
VARASRASGASTPSWTEYQLQMPSGTKRARAMPVLHASAEAGRGWESRRADTSPTGALSQVRYARSVSKLGSCHDDKPLAFWRMTSEAAFGWCPDESEVPSTRPSDEP